MKKEILTQARKYLLSAALVKMKCAELIRALEQSSSNMALELLAMAREPDDWSFDGGYTERAHSEEEYLKSLASYPLTAHMQANESTVHEDGEGTTLIILTRLIHEEMAKLLDADTKLAKLHDDHS